MAGALSVGLMLVVVRRHLGNQVEVVLTERAAHLSDDSNRAERTRGQAAPALPEDGRSVLESIKDVELDAAWPNSGEEYAPLVSATEGPSLQRPLTARLMVTVAAVGLLLTAYIYALCSSVVAIDTIESWTGMETVPSTEVLGLTLHGGVYLKVASLLGIAATATFLSFALIEDRFATALTKALLRDPADHLLALALPYVALREGAIAAQMAARQPPSSGSEGSGI
jgi:hypothetical protein